MVCVNGCSQTSSCINANEFQLAASHSNICKHYCKIKMFAFQRKHEPRCQRLGGRRSNNEYQFNDEEVNAAYPNTPRPTSSKQNKKATRRIKCQWCGESFSKSSVAEHLVNCDQKLPSYTPRVRLHACLYNYNFDNVPNSTCIFIIKFFLFFLTMLPNIFIF